jgi:hypothetical protein
VKETEMALLEKDTPIAVQEQLLHCDALVRRGTGGLRY